MDSDSMHMARALALAERGRGRTSPNPLVGAVVVDQDGVVVGSGAHEVAGGPHAEVEALVEAGLQARGATLYCTLEPCSHFGRTPPCAPRVVDAGIRRAVIAVEDPNPLVAGRGLSHLREHGVQVEVGLFRAAAVRLNAPFFTVMRHHRPFVTMKVALSEEGCVGLRSGGRARLTGPIADRWIHHERAATDAIAVGSGTVLADDPLLTARGAYRTRPLTRVVFDRRLRTPPSARLLSTLGAGPIIIVGAEPGDASARSRGEALARAGAQVEFIAEHAPRGLLPASLSALADRGVTSLILEGGPVLHAAFWDAGMVDRVQVFRTPVRLGSAGLSWLDPSRCSVADLEDVRSLRLGEDVMIEGYVHRAD